MITLKSNILNLKLFVLGFSFIFCFVFESYPSINETKIYQNIKFDHLTIENGLANSTIKGIIQDNKGFIWIAALNALCRYDGYEIKTYQHNPNFENSLSGDRITVLLEYRDGDILIGTWQKGLDILNSRNNKITHYIHNENDINSIGANDVETIFIDKDYNIWIGTANILNLFDKNNGIFRKFYLPDKNLIVNSIIEYNNELLISTSELKFFLFNKLKKTFTGFNIVPESANDKLIWRTKLYSDSKGIFWIASVKRGLFRYDSKAKKLENFINEKNNIFSLSNNDVFDIIEDENNKYWIATDGGGLNYFDYNNKKFYILKHDPLNNTSLSNNQPHCLFKDKTGILWIGMYNGGVNIYDKNKNKFTSYFHDPTDKKSLSDNVVWSFLEDNNGDIYIGTDRGGINIFNPDRYGNSFLHLIHNENDHASIPSNTIISLIKDKSGFIWIGTYNNGLIRYDKRNSTFLTYKAKKNNNLKVSKYPAGNDIWDILEDNDGKIWLATLRYGVDVFDKIENTFTHYNTQNSNLSNDQATVLFKDSKNRIWIGTAAGLNRFDKTTNDFICYKKFDKNFKLPGDNIRLIFEDSHHNLWIGTEGAGLCKTNIDSFLCKNYSESDGLASNIVYGMLEDNKGRLWISTSKGLSVYNPEKEEFKSYNKEEGLPSNEFKQGSCLKTSDGRMFFGGINGFTVFYPDSIKDNPNIPEVIITGLSILYKTIEPDDENSVLKEDITVTKSITLNYKQNVFSLRYTALNYTITDKNQYAYMLVGFEKDWNKVGNKREATYTNLRAGKYIFKVKASNNDGVWNEQGASLEIIILPPWWKTLIFKILLASFIIISIILIYNLRVRRLKKQKEELERQIAIHTRDLLEANKELKNQRDEIISQNEEIQQQNEEIVTQRDEIQKRNDELERSYNLIKTISDFGKELTNVLNLEQINNMIFNYVSLLFDTSVFGIGIYDSNTDSIVFKSLMEYGVTIPAFSCKLNDTTSCAVWCYKNQKNIISNDFKIEYKNYISEIYSRTSQIPSSVMYIPLTVKNKKIGVVVAQSYNKNAYTDKDLLILQTLASYVAIALDNAYTYEIILRQKEELDQHRMRLEKIVYERTKDLEAAKKKAEESDRLKSAFLANMSHEIRTPLNAIVGFVNILIQENLNEGAKKEIINVIEKNTQALLNLINDIIDFSRIEAGEIVIQKSQINIDNLLKELYYFYLAEIKKAGKYPNIELIITLNAEGKSTDIVTDSIRLRQIFNNLLNNALKFTDKGFIEFGYKNIDNKYITFFVKDSGIGIDKKYQKLIFDRFFKIENKETFYSGTGLGLSISKYLIERLGGNIWVESEPGHGAEFLFTLPYDVTHIDDINLTYNFETSSDNSFSWSNKTVLIVEDEFSNYKVVEYMLKPTNIKILWAKNGNEAFEYIIQKEGKIDIILMDIKLPKKDGITLTAEIKERYPNIPVVALTAYALVDEEYKIRESNFDDYISKPIVKKTFFNLLYKYLG
jgi:signal transduction histidine kinase/ligand-binding sensor domain-containing protein